MIDETDVLIVGAGASGALAARHFSEAGLKVVCLEQGEWVAPDSYSGGKPDWELQRRQRWSHNPNIRLAEADYPLEVSDSDLHPSMFNGVGGSTIVWGANWHRMVPADFKVRTLDGVASDWPISYWDLAPYYDRVEREGGVSGVAGDPAFPEFPAYPLPGLPIGEPGLRLAKTLNQLGWHWWPGSNAIASKKYENLNPCARLGVCGSGCPEGAKYSSDLVYWPKAVDAGAQLITGARVKEILVNGNGLATGAAWIDRSGTTHTTRAAVVILCANGIGTARLLLLSGIANSSGLVGKGLMLHPFFGVMASFDEDMKSWYGPAGQLIYSMQFYESDPSRGFLRGSKWSLLPGGHAVSSHPGLVAQSMEQAWGAAGHQAVKAALGKTCAWILVAEDLPEDSNYVTLDNELTDSDELPAPRIHYKLGENTKKLMAWHMEKAAYSMKMAGAHTVTPIPLFKDAVGHLMGTARMGLDPDRSVTDIIGRTHDIANLYIFDGSVFVTSGGVNPTGTILANALRCTEAVIAQRREQKTAA